MLSASSSAAVKGTACLDKASSVDADLLFLALKTVLNNLINRADFYAREANDKEKI